MDRHPEWCVIICLICVWQEISTVGAGLTEWFVSIKRGFLQWYICNSAQIAEKECLRSLDIPNDYAGINTFADERNNLIKHPTMKPIELIKDVVLDVSNRGDIVLDSFLSSGGTIIAAETCKRICMDIN